MAFWDEVAKKAGTDIKLLNGKTIPANGAVPATTGGQANTSTPGALGTGTATVGQPAALTTEQLAYFDKTYGGIDKYKGIQDERLMGAILSGDKDLEQRLLADNARVGYGINQEPIWARDNVLKGIEAQKLATDQQIANYMMMANQQAGANNQFLQEGIGTINKQKNQNDLRIQETENRFGGVYSGGLRLQQDGNTQRAGESVNNLQRDIASRNANIWQNFGQLASQAQAKIAQLTSSAPEMIRQAVLGVRDNNRQFALQEAGVTGMYNGQLTPDGAAQQLSNQINQIQLDALPEETKLGLELLQKQVAAGDIDLKTAQFQLDEMTNPNSVTNKMRNIELEMSQMEAEFMPQEQKLKLQQLRKTIANIGARQADTPEEKRMKEIQLEKAELELEEMKAGGGGDRSTAEIESDYISRISQIPSSKLKQFFTDEKANIVAELGINGYNRLYSQYFDE